MTNPILVVTAGLRQGTQLEINTQGIRIGRDPNNELHLDDPEVSRHHARVILHNGSVWVQDAGSRNGIFVNGNRVSGHKQISPGAQIQIGTHEFLIQLPQVGLDSSISVDLGSIGLAARNSETAAKKLPLLVGAAVCIALIGGMVVLKNMNSGSSSGPRTTTPAESPTTIGELSLNDLLGTTGPEGTQNDAANDENLTAAERLANSLQGSTEGVKIEPPPEGSSARELRDEAHELYQAEYFHDALIKYKQCTMLDPSMEVCRRRTTKLTDEIAQLKQEHHNSCLRYLEVQQYDQALASCEMVLQLETNPTADLHESAKRGIVKARAALNIDF
jgi:pSer/pThr/pTyr-binding forkhead associated (FHA) protein